MVGDGRQKQCGLRATGVVRQRGVHFRGQFTKAVGSHSGDPELAVSWRVGRKRAAGQLVSSRAGRDKLSQRICQKAMAVRTG